MVNCDARRLPPLPCIDRLPSSRSPALAPQPRHGDASRIDARLRRLGPPRLPPGRSAFSPAGRRRRRRRVAVWAAGEDRYEFNESHYKRLSLQLIVQTNESFSGTLILMEETTEPTSTEDAKCLLLQVGGDTMLGISYHAQNKEPQRPMTLNLLLQMLDHGKELSIRDWHLLHVAIVELKENTFIGRLFFGDPDTNEITWDCDCRPSDGCWLALKRMCPLYVHKSVWDECAQPLKVAFSVEQTRALLENMSQFSQVTGHAEEEGGDPMTSIRNADPAVIKRLKRQMAVAISEEDYSTAAKIRDHPYMTKYKMIHEHKQAGRFSEADDLEKDLEKEIEENDNTM